MVTESLDSIKATPAHAAQAWAVLCRAKLAMSEAGRSQWQGGYPSEADVLSDIAAGVARVLVCGDQVVGYCALVTTGDKNYAGITDGRWLTPHGTRYAVIHRLAIDPLVAGHGLAGRWLPMLNDEARCLQCDSMRIDTNHDNVQMLRLLPHSGFVYCGKVQQADGERMAFECVFV